MLIKGVKALSEKIRLRLQSQSRESESLKTPVLQFVEGIQLLYGSGDEGGMADDWGRQ